MLTGDHPDLQDFDFQQGVFFDFPPDSDPVIVPDRKAISGLKVVFRDGATPRSRKGIQGGTAAVDRKPVPIDRGVPGTTPRTFEYSDSLGESVEEVKSNLQDLLASPNPLVTAWQYYVFDPPASDSARAGLGELVSDDGLVVPASQNTYQLRSDATVLFRLVSIFFGNGSKGSVSSQTESFGFPATVAAGTRGDEAMSMIAAEKFGEVIEASRQ